MCVNENKNESPTKEPLENDEIYPVEQVPNIGDPSKQEVKAAINELNPDVNSLESR